jgi:ornithine cyclodeaminase/alanine dehydrogenase-like protein (mu-crystallin family)
MRIFDAAATRHALPFDALIPALRDLFAAGCVVPPRQVLEIAAPSGEGVTSLVMPAWIPGRYYGLKVVNVAPGNASRGLPALHASVLLHDAATGAPLALIDGDQVTARRTAAASALAASFLARADARHLLVVGAGRVARLLPAAYRVVRPIEQVTVWARRPQEAEALAHALADAGVAAAASTDLARAVAAADVVSVATLATTPLIEGRWLRPGSHLDLIGSFTAEMREADDACFAGAAVYVDTEEALQKSGDLLGPLARGVLTAADVRGTLATLARGAAQGRRDATERTVFKSVGTALEDLAAAILVHERG